MKPGRTGASISIFQRRRRYRRRCARRPVVGILGAHSHRNLWGGDELHSGNRFRGFALVQGDRLSVSGGRRSCRLPVSARNRCRALGSNELCCMRRSRWPPYTERGKHGPFCVAMIIWHAFCLGFCSDTLEPLFFSSPRGSLGRR